MVAASVASIKSVSSSRDHLRSESSSRASSSQLSKKSVRDEWSRCSRSWREKCEGTGGGGGAKFSRREAARRKSERRWLEKSGRGGREGRRVGGNVGRKRATRRKETAVASTARGNEDQGRKKEKDIWSREVSPYNRLGSLTYEASFACHLLHHLGSRCSFCAPFLGTSSFLVPSPRLHRSLARSRCTVAFGLCIIITVTASSSWLVVEKPPCLLPLPTR